ncbi:expressed unknown protein [Seminavis robusta]|uniref:Uncharacterized protein n=1 Tax=Seminavis robusta TaxID=568900 RepID=A0A9N8HSS0_9STRA|nr:expressed unknown protein [Seminavis robusta]|eukprot:Sro1764_g296070.1 n/a (345) ;mRNA; r:10320-11354
MPRSSLKRRRANKALDNPSDGTDETELDYALLKKLSRLAMLVVVLFLGTNTFRQIYEEILPGALNIGKRSLRSTNEKEEESYTLVVVNCRVNMTWLLQVPSDWRIIVYEKCGRQEELSHVTYHTPTNAGAEECNGYLDYMHDYYQDLTTVTVFMHGDGLRSFSRHSGTSAHTPFDTFEPIANATRQFVTREHPFLHFGIKELAEWWGRDPNHGQAMKILWPLFRLSANSLLGGGTMSEDATRKVPKPPIQLTFRPSAHFAVRKEQIQMHPQSTYYALLQQLRHSNLIGDYPGAREFCCAMERMWHIFFGEPAILPKRASASDLLNITECEMCHHPEQANPHYAS